MAVNISFAKAMTRLQEKFLRRRVFFIGTICLFQESAMKNAADTLSWHFLKGLLSRYCVRARKGTPDIHRSGPSVRAGMTGRPHPPREPCCHNGQPPACSSSATQTPCVLFLKNIFASPPHSKTGNKKRPEGCILV